MAKLNDDEQRSLDELLAKKDAPDDPAGPSSSRIENVNYTIDLDNEVQVKRAVKAGLLPASFLDDDAPDDDDDPDDAGQTDDAPRRRLDTRYS